MTPLEVGKIFNAASITVLLGVSLLVGARYPGPFFRHWAWGLVGAWVVVAFEWLTTYMGRPAWYEVLFVGLCTFQTWHLLQAGRVLDRAPWPARGLGIALAATMGVALLVAAAGVPFVATTAPSVVVYALVYVWLGQKLFRLRPGTREVGGRFLGGAIMASGLWLFTFPLAASSPDGWVGYLGVTMMNVLVGMGLIMFLLDETGRDLAAKNAELTRLDALKTSFIRTMSHELRTPLTAIMAAGWLLRESRAHPLPPEQLAHARTVTEQSELLERLVAEVLDYARLESGTMAFERTRVDLREVARRCVRAMEPVLAANGLTLTYEAPVAPIEVEADRERLAQVGLNLLSNAAKFTPEGGAVVLSVRLEGDRALLAVEDTGIGIPPEHHAKVFERFHQVDPTPTRRKGGMGLGLALCRAIVEDGHQGTIHVESAPGRGSRFVVALPRAGGAAAG